MNEWDQTLESCSGIQRVHLNCAFRSYIPIVLKELVFCWNIQSKLLHYLEYSQRSCSILWVQFVRFSGFILNVPKEWIRSLQLILIAVKNLGKMISKLREISLNFGMTVFCCNVFLVCERLLEALYILLQSVATLSVIFLWFSLFFNFYHPWLNALAIVLEWI